MRPRRADKSAGDGVRRLGRRLSLITAEACGPWSPARLGYSPFGGISHVAAAAETTATPVATRNASSNPDAVVVLVRLAAALETAAAPAEAPNSWKVLTIPEVTPASCGATLPSAVAEATTNSAPSPAEATLTPATMAAVPDQSTGARNPAAAINKATAARGRAPRRPAAMTLAIGKGNQALEAVDLAGDPRLALARLVEASWHLVDQARALLVAAQKELPPGRGKGTPRTA